MGKPPDVKGVTPERVFQKIESEDLFETDLKFEPAYVPWIFIENVIQRTLARMVGQGPYGPVTVKCTKEGNLAVVSRGGAFDDYQRLQDSFAAVAGELEFTFAQQVERIDIFTYGGVVDYQLTRDAVKAYGSKIQLFEDSFYSLDFYTLRVKATLVSIAAIVSGSATSTSGDHLVDSAATFIAHGIKATQVIENTTDDTFALVTAVNSETDLTLDTDIMVSGEAYKVGDPKVKLMGWFRAEE